MDCNEFIMTNIIIFMWFLAGLAFHRKIPETDISAEGKATCYV